MRRKFSLLTLSAVLLFAWLGGLGSPVSWATLYQCTNATGGIVFTDSPAQLKDCRAVDARVPSLPALSNPPRPSVVQPATPRESGSIPQAISPEAAPRRLSTITTEGGAILVPLHRVGRSLVVEALVNESRGVRLIVDTGADITVLSHAVADELGLASTQTANQRSSVRLKTVAGSVQATMVMVDMIRVGAAQADQVSVAIHDLPNMPGEVDGLLGLTFLDRFRVTVDAQNGELLLTPKQ